MGTFINLVGKKFGKLLVLSESKRAKNGASMWNCLCDCGVKKIIRGTNLTTGVTRSCGCRRTEVNKSRIGPKAPMWKGGRHADSRGYVLIYKPGHPNSQRNNTGYVLEHILVMSNFLGRPLTREETVHHRNGIRDDNRLENLELWGSSHPPGQRAEDMIRFCIEYLERFGFSVLDKELKLTVDDTGAVITTLIP